MARVNDSVVNNIRLIGGQELQLEVSCRSFEPGQRVVIRQEPLTGLSGEVVQYNSKRKLLIKVDLLNRNILITLPEEYLMAD